MAGENGGDHPDHGKRKQQAHGQGLHGAGLSFAAVPFYGKAYGLCFLLRKLCGFVKKIHPQLGDDKAVFFRQL